MALDKFYVYEHWRPDKNVCFYVGKGNGRRAQTVSRPHNPHYGNIVAKLARLGMRVEVRMVADCLNEADSFTLERDRIAYWRGNGVTLANRTAGGDGVSNPSPETRAKMSASSKARMSDPSFRDKVLGALLSQEARAKVVATKNTKEWRETIRVRFSSADIRAKFSARTKRQMLDAEYRAKAIANLRSGVAQEKIRRIRQSPEFRQRCRERMLGRTQSEETKAKRAASLTGRPCSVETRAKLAAQRGWKHSEEAKAKMRGRKRSQAHCEKLSEIARARIARRTAPNPGGDYQCVASPIK